MFLVQINYTLDQFIFQSLFFSVLRIFFLESRAPLIQSNARVTCFSFVRHIFSTSHEGGGWMHASLALSISVSEFHYNQRYYCTAYYVLKQQASRTVTEVYDVQERTS